MMQMVGDIRQGSEIPAHREPDDLRAGEDKLSPPRFGADLRNGEVLTLGNLRNQLRDESSRLQWIADRDGD